jgi:hypothetical protein
MLARFDFKVSLLSMAVLFVASVLVSIGLKYGATSGWIPAQLLFATFSFGTAEVLLSAIRGFLVLLIAIYPFRTDVAMSPVPLRWWVPFCTSLVGTAFPWLLLFIPGLQWYTVPVDLQSLVDVTTVARLSLVTVFLSHLAAGLWFVFFFADWDYKKPTESVSGPA